MVAGIIGEIGIIPKQQLTAFPALFIAMQKLGKTPDDSLVKTNCEKLLAPFKKLAQEQAESLESPFLVT